MITYAIGDVQGCYAALQRLLELIRFDPIQDRLWFVGDLVNRGPDSDAVLRFVKQLGSAAITVLGNHDLHLLAVWAGIARLRPDDTLHSVLSAPDCEELLTWLRHQPLIHQEGTYLLVHAGLLPQWTATQAVHLAQEVERVLQQDDFRLALSSIYYLKQDASSVWSDDLPAPMRLGFIANVLTRLRVCSPEGLPLFSFTGPPEAVPPGYLPWFEVPGRRSAQDTIVFGHWSALGVLIDSHVLALDGGCVWGRELVAVRLEDRRMFRVRCSA
ncbi:MAG: symmetrical bis(5'-nucleosyl)-tetraphosphatase [Nitrospirae bacterium]|nr:MAG: symmetrical bis(5'-nucleosyl)-tetraphosphatase [Nitrospirota bacterium]